MSRPVYYEPHPCSDKRKAELRAKGYQVVDAKFKPVDWVDPEKPKRARKVKEVSEDDG